MGGQVLGGGIIVLVAVVLWLVYLLPSWYGRHQFDAAERNAVRLNQALRVLAETSETPAEVRLELNARTALAQQKLARKAQAEREESARRAQHERDALARRAQARQEILARKALEERQHAEVALRQAELERARIVRLAALRQPQVRRARARRRTRMTITVAALGALALTGVGAAEIIAAGAATLAWIGGASTVTCALLLVRMARVGRRAVAREIAVAQPVSGRIRREAQDVSLVDQRAWHPRELPRPLTVSAGSQAAAVLDAAAAREQVRQARLDEPLRERAERSRPAELDAARVQRMGHVDDDEIEAHVRELLRRRAVG
ncbi:large exoprotein [Microbacterium sp. SYP-A9085]|uniref:large exoprotein n=1 Tax=Microbacterium sp. SYP-A9085 TaxID=2664454 RepID=UPI00129A3DDE|nr:large exoprotein [Microbacterium sp. SYP-A9085]MRH28795.1 large exoprotein [Microbacterium sp. SYP-A9085]